MWSLRAADEGAVNRREFLKAVGVASAALAANPVLRLLPQGPAPIRLRLHTDFGANITWLVPNAELTRLPWGDIPVGYHMSDNEIMIGLPYLEELRGEDWYVIGVVDSIELTKHFEHVALDAGAGTTHVLGNGVIERLEITYS